MSIDGVTALWDRLFSAQPDPPGLLVLITALVGLAAVAFRPVWRILRNAVTIAHATAAAMASCATRRRDPARTSRREVRNSTMY